MFVKSATEDASLGISQASIVQSQEALEKRVAFIHENVQTDAVVEQYIEGRELTVTLLGNKRISALPVFELFFRTVPEGTAPIATAKVKWDEAYQEKIDVTVAPAPDLDPVVERRISRLARRVFRLLDMSGYARIDLRLRPDGSVVVLEANANPNLAQSEDLALSALASGMGYDELLERILRLGLGYEAAWRQT